jgi:hypothetical protein
MEIVERREHGGTWWGRTTDGAWVRWSPATGAWEGPMAPPWPPAERSHPDEAAIVAHALAATTLSGPGGHGGPPPPMNRLDAWWNRRFPPYSGRRLVFGLVVLPVIAALVELLWVMGGHEASLPRYLFVCVAGGAVLAMAWLPAMRAIAQRLQASGAFASRSPWPWKRKHDAPPPPPLPPLRTTFGRDFLVALPFCAVIVAVMSLTVAGPDDTFSAGGLGAIAIGSVFASGLVALRTSVWSLAIFSVAGGLLGGIAMVLLSIMTFSDPGGVDFFVGWAFGTVTVFVSGYPMWRGLRDLEARGFRLPMWIVMGGSVLLVSGAALVYLAER